MNRQLQTKEDKIMYNSPISVRSNESAKKKPNNSGQTSYLSGKISQELTKDSGIGATYLATSSGSTSENTSPESEKDVQIQNGKAPKALSASVIDAASTPATQTQIKKLKFIHAKGQLEPCGDLTFDEENSMHTLISTPLAGRNRTVKKYKDFDKLRGTEQNTNSADNKEVIAKLIENFNEACQTPGRKRQRRMHACEFCDKQFDRPSLLKRHNLTHTGERPFECRFCSKGFSTRSGVNTHERTHTGQRPYVCRICGRRFAAGSNLIFHKYTHTNTRRHVCSQCPKAFVTPGDLRKHEYTHTGEWPFRCHLCDRGFATERNLRSHEITHTGQKPHICPICNKGYAQESSLKTHIRTHQKSNGTKSDKASISALEPECKPTSKEPQTPVIQNSTTSKPVWQSTENHPHLSPYYLPNTQQLTHNVSEYSASSDSSLVISHPSNASHQYRSAFTTLQPTLSLNRSTMQSQMSAIVNNPELQSLLYDRYRVYYELYMKALSHPQDYHTIGSIGNHIQSSVNLPNTIVPPNFSYSPQVLPPMVNTQPLNNPQGLLFSQCVDHSTSSLNDLPQIFQSTSTYPSLQEITSSQNLLGRPTVRQMTQPQPLTQSQTTTTNNDFDLQPLDYSIRGLSNWGRK